MWDGLRPLTQDPLVERGTSRATRQGWRLVPGMLKKDAWKFWASACWAVCSERSRCHGGKQLLIPF